MSILFSLVKYWPDPLYIFNFHVGFWVIGIHTFVRSLSLICEAIVGGRSTETQEHKKPNNWNLQARQIEGSFFIVACSSMNGYLFYGERHLQELWWDNWILAFACIWLSTRNLNPIVILISGSFVIFYFDCTTTEQSILPSLSSNRSSTALHWRF